MKKAIIAEVAVMRGKEDKRRIRSQHRQKLGVMSSRS
jgi:hypothetical protein